MRQWAWKGTINEWYNVHCKEVCVCVCQRVPDQLYGTVPSLEQSPGLMFKHRPLRRPLGCCLAASLHLIEIVFCVCVLYWKKYRGAWFKKVHYTRVFQELLLYHEVLDVVFNIVRFQSLYTHKHKSWLHRFVKRLVSANYVIWDMSFITHRPPFQRRLWWDLMVMLTSRLLAFFYLFIFCIPTVLVLS